MSSAAMQQLHCDSCTCTLDVAPLSVSLLCQDHQPCKSMGQDMKQVHTGLFPLHPMHDWLFTLFKVVKLASAGPVSSSCPSLHQCFRKPLACKAALVYICRIVIWRKLTHSPSHPPTHPTPPPLTHSIDCLTAVFQTVMTS